MRGGNAQDRRRQRRAAERRVAAKATAAGYVETLAAAETFSAAVADEQAEEFEAISALAATTTETPEAEQAVEAEELGGDPSPGTPPDKRLKENKAKKGNLEPLPEMEALDRFEQHLPALYAAAGDVAWGPEEGFVDLLSDLNETLGNSDDAEAEAAEPMEYRMAPRAIDVSVKLDKALICSEDGYMVAPVSIGRDGEPQIGPQDSWVPVESGWIESAPDSDDDEAVTASTVAATKLRFALLDFVLADYAAAPEVELPDAHKPGARMPRRRPGPAAPEPLAAPTGGTAWEALFLPEGKLTDDGRAFAPGAISWRDLPLSLMAMTETSAQGGHDGAQLAGRIDRIWRDGNMIRAAGVFDNGEFGQEVARLVADGVLRGVSVDTAIQEYQVGPRSDYFTDDGDWIEQDPDKPQEEQDVLDLLFRDADENTIFVVTKATIGMSTICPFPAFADAAISLAASGSIWSYTHQGGFVVTARKALVAAAAPEPVAVEDSPARAEPGSEGEALTASAAGLAPVHPPAEWFENPALEALTPLTVTDDGRIYGHAWSWDTCHVSFPDACVLAPHTDADNAYFHLGEIECEGGETVAVGKITLDTGHAGPRASRAQAVTHYDHTGTVAAHVRCGEDSFGGWISGAINPELSEEKLRILRGAALSGDWRAVRTATGGSNLELVALLAVNVPGFPVPRQPKALVASGDQGMEPLALVAAGIVTAETAAAADEATIAALARTVTVEEADLDGIAALAEQALACGCGD